MNRFTILVALALFTATPAQSEIADSSGCGLALAFALDISVSVDAVEYDLQLEGLASALKDSSVTEAILSQRGAVALMAYEWSGHKHQSVIVPWSMIDEAKDISDFAGRLRAHRRSNQDYPTGLGTAISYGLTMLDAAAHCERKVLDISGDGVSNDGYPPESAYKAFSLAGVTINALVVEGAEAGVLDFFLRSVIRGPGAFVEAADGYADYARAMRRKLLREVQGFQYARKD